MLIQEVFLGDGFDLKQGTHLPLNELIGDGNFDVFGANGKVGKFNKYMYEEPVVLITCRGATCGSINLTTSRSWVTGNAIAVKPKCEVDTKFLYYQLKASSFQDVISGSAQPQITVSTLARKRIKIPSLSTQKQIAQILEEADTARQKRKAANALTNQFLQSTFLSMFGDPASNDHKFDKKSISDLKCQIQIGPFGTQLHVEDYIEDGIPLINPTHIQNKKIVESSRLTITKAKHQKLSNYHLKEGDVIMARRGEMGRCALITKREEGWLCGTGSLFIRPPKEINSTFLLYVTSHESIRKKLENDAQGVTMANLNQTIIKNLEIIIPPLELQQKFASIVADTETLRQKQKQSEAELEHLFQALLQRYFSS